MASNVCSPEHWKSPASPSADPCGSLLEYNKAINACVKQSQWQRALALLPELEEYELQASLVTYNTAASACVRGAQWELALSFLHQLQHDRLADVITFSTTLSSLEVASLWAEAITLLLSMADVEVVRNSITYNAAISACAKGYSNEWSTCRSWVHQHLPKCSLS